MTIGFAAQLAEVTEDASPSVEDMATLAIESKAVNLDRVLAFYAARHLMGDLKPAPEDLAAFANWLTKGEATSTDEDEEEAEDEEAEEGEEEEEVEGFAEVQMRDQWSDVLLNVLRQAAANVPYMVATLAIAYLWLAP